MSSTFIKKFKRLIWVSIIFSALFQLLFYNSWGNLFAVGLILIAWFFISGLILNKNRFNKFPISSFLVFGYSFTQLILPIIFTTLENKPVIYNLQLPYKVFTHSFLSFLIILLSHELYIRSNFVSLINFRVKKRLARFSFFTPPSVFQLWVLGFIGLFGMLFSQMSEAGVLGKVLHGLEIFLYAPYFLFFLDLTEFKKIQRSISKNQIFLILIYTGFIFVFSIAKNSRGSFMNSFTALGFTYFLGLLVNHYNSKIFTFRNLTIISLAFWLITGPLTDIGIAMVIVRGSRGDVEKKVLVEKTIETYKNKDLIHMYKKMAKTETIEIGGWDERYLDNIFLSRFCNVKFIDASLVCAERLNNGNSHYKRFIINQFLATFPAPVLKFLSINIPKKTLTSMSAGDYLYHLTGAANAIGGFRTGNFSGTGMAAFGWFYLFILGVLIFPLFFLLDTLVYFRKDPENDRVIPIFSFAILLSITDVFVFLPDESVLDIASYIVRGWLQMMLFYFVLFKLSAFIETISFPNKKTFRSI